MNPFRVLFFFGIRHQVRSRWIFAYGLFYFIVGIGLLHLGGDSKRFIGSFSNLVILFNPAVALLYSTVHWYSSRSYHHLILTQPIHRSVVLLSTWISIFAGLSLAFVLGCLGSQLLMGAINVDLIHLVFIGLGLNAVFSIIGLLWAIAVEDKMKGLAGALGTWLYFSVLHDGIVFLFLVLFRDYPMDKPAFALLMLNPIDLSRLYLLFKFDLAALMGYTGSVLQQMSKGTWGMVLFSAGILFWGVLPLWVANRLFRKKNL